MSETGSNQRPSQARRPMRVPARKGTLPTTRAALGALGAASAAAALVAITGCTSTGTAQMNSAVSSQGAPQVRRLLVVANVEDQHFTKTHYADFKDGFGDALKECGTVVEHLHFNRLDLDWRKTVDGRLRAVHADSLLIVRNAGGGSVMVGSGGNHNDLNYEARLLDLGGKEVWRARTQFRFLSRNLFTVDKAGQGLGKAVAERMRKDALISGCGAATAAGKS